MVFVHGTFMGGYDEVKAAFESGALEEQLAAHHYQPQTEEAKKTLSITINVRGTAKAIVKEEEEEEKKAGAVPTIVEVADEKKEDDEATQASTTQHSTTSHHHHNALMHKLIVHENNQHSVVVWYKASDPKSQAARTLLESAQELEDLNIAYHDMDAMPDHQLLEEELKHMTGQSSVPAVFVDGLHLGGNAELEAAFESGDLKELLMAGKPL